jgi:hypothetical protein
VGILNVSRVAPLWPTSSFAALHSMANLLPLPPLIAALQNDSRLSQTVVADKGFASVRRVGNSLYAAISDTSKGLQTMCNGGFLAGKDSALLLEGLVSPAGAAFQMDAFRTVSQVPVNAADRSRPLRRKRCGSDVCTSFFAYRYAGQKRIEV